MKKNQFCSYQQSLDLKNLGFLEPCFAYYGEINGGEIEIFFKKSFDTEAFYVLAPLKQQALDFFREKFNIQFGIFYVSDLNQYEFYFALSKEIEGIDDIMEKTKIIHTKYSDWAYETYEEAEEAMISRLTWAAKYKE